MKKREPSQTLADALDALSGKPRLHMKEQVYDERIAPLVRQVAEACRESGIAVTLFQLTTEADEGYDAAVGPLYRSEIHVPADGGGQKIQVVAKIAGAERVVVHDARGGARGGRVVH